MRIEAHGAGPLKTGAALGEVTARGSDYSSLSRARHCPPPMASVFDRAAAAARALIDPPKAAPVLTARAAPLELKASDALKAVMYHRVGIDQYPPSDYRQLVRRYGTNSIVRRCVKMISEAVGQIPPVVKVGEREDHPLAKHIAKLIKAPNPRQDRTSLMEELAGYFLLHGNAFVELAPGMSKAYAQFYALRPEFVIIVPGQDGWASAYRYRPGTGAEKTWPVDIERGKSGILHIKDFSPDDDLWGRGALRSVEKELTTYDNAFEFARALIQNGAMPSGALKYAPNVAAGEPTPVLSDEQFQRLKKQLDDQTQMKKKGRPMLLEGGLDWVQFSMTMVDMQAEELRNAAARGICLGFGAPPMLLGIPGDNTYSNFKEANRALYRQAVIPLAARLYGAIGRWVGEWVGERSLEIGIDEDKIYALAEELTENYQRLETSRFLTIDEKRQAAGYDPLPDGMGNRIMVNGFETPLDASLASAEIGLESAAAGVEGQILSNQLMAANPGYDPGKDRDKDGTSKEGGADEGGVSKPKDGKGSK